MYTSYRQHVLVYSIDKGNIRKNIYIYIWRERERDLTRFDYLLRTIGTDFATGSLPLHDRHEASASRTRKEKCMFTEQKKQLYGFDP